MKLYKANVRFTVRDSGRWTTWAGAVSAMDKEAAHPLAVQAAARSIEPRLIGSFTVRLKEIKRVRSKRVL